MQLLYILSASVKFITVSCTIAFRGKTTRADLQRSRFENKKDFKEGSHHVNTQIEEELKRSSKIGAFVL